MDLSWQMRGGSKSHSHGECILAAIVCCLPIHQNVYSFLLNHIFCARQREAHDRAKRVFGESNPEYVAIKRQYLLINTSHGARKGTLLTKNTKLDGMEVTILRNTKDRGKYIVEYVSPETGVPQKLKVAPAQIILAPDTPVTNGREKYNLFVVSYDKKTDEYRLFAVRKTDRGSEYTFDTFPRKEFRVRFDPVPRFEF